MTTLEKVMVQDLLDEGSLCFPIEACCIPQSRHVTSVNRGDLSQSRVGFLNRVNSPPRNALDQVRWPRSIKAGCLLEPGRQAISSKENHLFQSSPLHDFQSPVLGRAPWKNTRAAHVSFVRVHKVHTPVCGTLAGPDGGGANAAVDVRMQLDFGNVTTQFNILLLHFKKAADTHV